MALTTSYELFPTIFTILPTGILGVAITLLVYRLCLHPLAAFPGPFEAKLSGFWRDRQYWKGEWHDVILKLHREFGPVVRIAPNELSLVDAAALRLLFNHGTKALKTDWYQTWHPGNVGPGLFPAQDKALHSILRKRVSSAYSMTSLMRYEAYVQECLDLLFVKLGRISKTGDIVDMATWTGRLAYDVVTSLGYGTPVGMIKTESDVMSIQKNVHTAFLIMANMGHYWGQSRWITGSRSMKIMERIGVPNPLAEFQRWSFEQLESRKKSDSQTKRADMLAHFIQIDNDLGMSNDEHAKTEPFVLVGAGSDTSAAAMRACLYYLCKNGDIYQRTQQEVNEYYNRKQLKQPMTYQQTLELPFFCAVIKECMRMFPSIPYQLVRYAPEDMDVAGKRIPAGTIVGMSAMAANRDKEVWGEDANEFNPLRWLGDEERVRYLNTHDLTWGGSGPRTCIGRNIALMEVHKFLAQFLHNFNAEFVDPEKPWKVRTMWFAIQYNMHMRITYRGDTQEIGEGV